MSESSKQQIAKELTQKLIAQENYTGELSLNLDSSDCPPDCIEIDGKCYCPEEPVSNSKKSKETEISGKSRCKPGCFYVRGRCWCLTE